MIHTFLTNKGDQYEWDDFLSLQTGNQIVNRARNYCNSIDVLYPCASGVAFCNEQGLQKLQTLASLLIDQPGKVCEWLDREEAVLGHKF